MQASLNQLAEILAERVGRQYDITYREELKVIIEYWRVKLVVDSLNSRPKDRNFFNKWIEVPLEVVNESGFEGYPDSPVLRSKCQIPATIRANSKQFDFVGKLNRLEHIPFTDPFLIPYLNDSEWGGKPIRAAIVNGYMYIYNTLSLPGIAICMIPESLDEFYSCCVDCASTHCYNHDLPYPLPGDLQQRLVQAILATELKQPVPEPNIEIPATKLDS